MKVLIYGGNFDPVHKGHYALLKAACKEIKPDAVHIFTAYQSPYKEKSPTPFKLRQKMAKDVLGDISKNIIFDDFELKAKRVVYTWETVRYVKRLYPKAQVYLLVGADCLNTLHKWKNVKYLLKNSIIAAGRRTGFKFETKGLNFILLDGHFPPISSTTVRLEVLSNGILPDTISPKTASTVEKNLMYGLHIHKWLSSNLRPNRYLHVKLVAQAAVDFARHYNANAEKLALAGVLHDMAKCMDDNELITYAAKNKLKVKNFENICKYSPSLLHADVSAHMAKKLFNVKDKEVLSAIKCHTLGKKNMTEIEKILFIADMTSKDRRYKDAQKIRAAAFKSLDEGLLAALSLKLIFTIKTRKWISGVDIYNSMAAEYRL